MGRTAIQRATERADRQTPSGGTANETAAPKREWRDHLDAVLASYVAYRGFSEQQQRILTLYLQGANDKQIAFSSGCAEPTIYEHWRRMARKTGGCHKCDVIADFHRFLGGGGS
jgi:DNA-binding NarL/FixJ family response regulator